MPTRFALFLATLLFAVSSLAAETRLRVVDPAGAPVAGAIVVVTSPSGAFTRTTVADGTATVNAPADATVTIEADGFAPAAARLATIGAVAVVLEPATYAETVTVSASRSRVPLAELSSAVSVVSGERLRDELRTSRTIADALGKLVPGLAPGSGSASLYGQTIRGRGVQVLVDGIPLTTLRNGSRDLVAIDPSSIERVDVLRGTTAVYGDGATGGLINIVTRTAAGKETSFETTLSTRAGLTGSSESLGGRLAQSISGATGRLQWRADVALDRTGASFDAEGDRIQPDPYGQGGVDDAEAASLLTKLAWNFDAERSLHFSALAYEMEQDTEWTTDPSVNSLPTLSVKSRPIRGLDMEHPQGSTNQLLRLAYEDADLLGSRVALQAFARDYQTVFTPFDGRSLAIYGHKIFQSRIESESTGLRLDAESRLPVRGLTLFWGADATSEKTEQPVWIIDPAAWDASGGRTIRATDDRPWVPLIDKQSRAAFAQLEWMATPRWLFRGGLRYDGVDAGIPTFTTLTGAVIDGGARSWSDALFNIGIVFYARPDTRIWGGFSQGFSLPDIGLVLRSAPPGATLDTLPFQPQIVDAWEAGTSTDRGNWSASFAAFYNTSEHGTSTAGFNQPVVRAPERVYGFEITGAFDFDDRWRTGGTVAYNEGKSDPNRDGVYTWLNHYRIAAPNATAFVEHETRSWWTNRLSVLWSGDRDRFPGSTRFGERPIESYTVVDWLGSFELPYGSLDVGIENLLNAEYFVRDAQLLRSGRNDSHSMAPGARLTIAWSIRY
ncbi:MAG: TonB-dependent receptor [Thermoanaerobaculia bacterium]